VTVNSDSLSIAFQVKDLVGFQKLHAGEVFIVPRFADARLEIRRYVRSVDKRASRLIFASSAIERFFME
jgi:hypothetical protein